MISCDFAAFDISESIYRIYNFIGYHILERKLVIKVSFEDGVSVSNVGILVIVYSILTLEHDFFLSRKSLTKKAYCFPQKEKKLAIVTNTCFASL